MNSKKGQGISMETIVIAVIVVAVLVVLLLVFTGRINIFGVNLKSCAGSAGFCSSNGCSQLTFNSVQKNYAKIFDITDEAKQCSGSKDPSGQATPTGSVCCSIVGQDTG
ncbi:MAG: hypothetical protein EPN86_01315 [Nanoarchaeota archaeon]|nr:MAG: hypothetical protein EPN86_01315 [Nanoarchaeota archaeon]